MNGDETNESVIGTTSQTAEMITKAVKVFIAFRNLRAERISISSCHYLDTS